MVVITVPMIVAAMMATTHPQPKQCQPIRVGIPRGETPTKVEPYRPPQLTTPSEK